MIVQTETQALRDALDAMREALEAGVLFPHLPELTRSERQVLAFIAKHGPASRERIAAWLYSDRPGDPPDPRIVDVFVNSLRKKLGSRSIEIQTRYGYGWHLPPASLDIVLDQRRAAA